MAGKSSPEAMDRMINNITKFIQVQQSVAQSLKSDYIAVGEEWDDKQYQNLGAVIDQAVAALSSNYATLSECTTSAVVFSFHRYRIARRLKEGHQIHPLPV